MGDRPPVSVVVPTRDRPDPLQRCLAALTAEVRPRDEVVVVDSASVGSGPQEVAQQAGARLIIATRPGASLARNLGWRTARHDVIAFVDDDVVVTGGWLDALVAPFVDADPDLAFVTGRAEAPPDRATERAIVVSFGDAPRPIGPHTTGAWGGSLNVAFRRRALEDVGGFDETLGPGTWTASAEDLDLFDRLFAAGWNGRYEPRALVHHDDRRSRSDLLRLDWGYGKGMGVRLVRLARSDPVRARRIAREVVWDGGVRTVVRDVRSGYEFGALTGAVRTLGTVVGAVATVAARSGR